MISNFFGTLAIALAEPVAQPGLGTWDVIHAHVPHPALSSFEDRVCINPHHYQLYVQAARSHNIVFGPGKINCMPTEIYLHTCSFISHQCQPTYQSGRCRGSIQPPASSKCRSQFTASWTIRLAPKHSTASWQARVRRMLARTISP